MAEIWCGTSSAVWYENSPYKGFSAGPKRLAYLSKSTKIYLRYTQGAFMLFPVAYQRLIRHMKGLQAHIQWLQYVQNTSCFVLELPEINF